MRARARLLQFEGPVVPRASSLPKRAGDEVLQQRDQPLIESPARLAQQPCRASSQNIRVLERVQVAPTRGQVPGRCCYRRGVPGRVVLRQAGHAGAQLLGYRQGLPRERWLSRWPSRQARLILLQHALYGHPNHPIHGGLAVVHSSIHVIQPRCWSVALLLQHGVGGPRQRGLGISFPPIEPLQVQVVGRGPVPAG